MYLSDYFSEVGTQLSSLLGGEKSDRWVLEAMDGLERRIHVCKAKLRDLRTSLEEMERRIRLKEVRVERLTDRIEVYLHLGDQANAWQYAMSLDQLRRLVDEERAQFLKLRLAFAALKARKQHFQEKLANLLAMFYPIH
jgi:hypothetical protein